MGIHTNERRHIRMYDQTQALTYEDSHTNTHAGPAHTLPHILTYAYTDAHARTHARVKVSHYMSRFSPFYNNSLYPTMECQSKAGNITFAVV